MKNFEDCDHHFDYSLNSPTDIGMMCRECGANGVFNPFAEIERKNRRYQKLFNFYGVNNETAEFKRGFLMAAKLFECEDHLQMTDEEFDTAVESMFGISDLMRGVEKEG